MKKLSSKKKSFTKEELQQFHSGNFSYETSATYLLVKKTMEDEKQKFSATHIIKQGDYGLIVTSTYVCYELYGRPISQHSVSDLLRQIFLPGLPSGAMAYAKYA